jgi:hypothetical protein
MKVAHQTFLEISVLGLVSNRRERRDRKMFFVLGLSHNQKAVLINPDQVLYVQAAGWFGKKSALLLTHRKRLVVDQNPEIVRQRFEDYLNNVVSKEDTRRDDILHESDDESEILQ